MALKILQWNIKGYLNNFSELTVLIRQHNLKLLCLQETHLHNTDNIPIPVNFTLHSHNTTTTKYGGVCILIHKSIQHSLIEKNPKYDSITLNLFSKQQFNITTIYIPPHQRFNTIDLHKLTIFNKNPSLITGDFNCHHRNWGSPTDNKKGKILANFISQSDFILLNKGNPTHFSTHNSFTHVDISFCSPEIFPHLQWNISEDLHGSDHFPVLISLGQKTTTNSRNFLPKFKLNQADWNKFSKNSIYYNNLLPPVNNVNAEAAKIRRIILNTANSSIPRQLPYYGTYYTPWWNDQLTQLKKLRNNAWSTYKRNLNTTNLIEYKKSNAKLKREIKIAKKQSINKLTSEINPNTPTKKVWSNIRRYCGYKISHNIHAILPTPSSTQFMTDPKKIADSFATHWSTQSSDSNFSTSFQTHKNNIQNTLRLQNPSQAAQILEKDITYIELCAALSKLKGHTPGIDRITYQMIKNLSKDVKTRILNHYNNIFNSTIPQQYKTSLVIPINKPNTNKTAINSYRPISLNPCLSKLLDKIIAGRLWWYTNNTNLLSNRQMGFRKGKTVTDTLLCIDYHATSALSRKNHLSIISLDFEKAFEKIGIHTIINQLTEWRVGPKIINYVKNFISNRKIIVKVNNQHSKQLPLENGIPQGSPLSVILFLIAYNSLSSIISLHKEIQLYAYADDFNLIIPLKRHNSPTINLSHLFKQISDWCNYSGATLSPNKTKHLHICRKKHCSPTLIANNTNIEAVNNLKILGVILTNRYHWKTHIDNLAKSLENKVNVIKCLSNSKHNCNTSTLLSASNALILAKIGYSLPIYGFTPSNNLRKIKTIINTAIRSCLGALRSTPIINLQQETNIPPLEIQRNIQTAKIYKSFLLCSDSPLHNIYKSIIKSKKIPKIQSAIHRAINICKTLEIPHKPQQAMKTQPYWLFKSNTIIKDMNTYKKSNTNQAVYQTLFKEIENKYNNYNFIYTDSSQQNTIVGFAVTHNNQIINTGVLPIHSSSYSGEIIAILNALLHTKKDKQQQYCICTDSLASINAIENISNNHYYPQLIRNLLIQQSPKVKLIWIPGHANIIGNEYADQSAKIATLSPLITTDNIENKDINKFIKRTYKNDFLKQFQHTSSWYKKINCKKKPDHTTLNIELNTINRLDQIKFERIRLGHTKLTHSHLMNNKPPPYCPCNQNTLIKLDHLISDCTRYEKERRNIFKNKDPIELISVPNACNIKTITNFLKLTKIYHQI